ncbi:MAG TPA: hypothetical protein VMV10_01130 [Pirellulales bacterium]|nr:hypothetical protein [Pirellulales bacterium]
MQITLAYAHWRGKPTSWFRIVAENGHSILLQSDWDYAGAAATFGWVPCPCKQTDGTVRCAHRTVQDMIWEAYEFLKDTVGKTVEDPGYF